MNLHNVILFVKLISTFILQFNKVKLFLDFKLYFLFASIKSQIVFVYYWIHRIIQ